jgi:hypothetical protein
VSRIGSILAHLEARGGRGTHRRSTARRARRLGRSAALRALTGYFAANASGQLRITEKAGDVAVAGATFITNF